jgi:hypothetical protein
MTPDAIANCERLRKCFEGREAIYIENGALRVRVTGIHANVPAQTITAELDEIPTPGLPRFIGLNSVGLTDSRRLQWTISAGHLTAISDHAWSLGDGGWSLFFDADLIREVMKFTETYSLALELDVYARYRNILGWVQCHKSTQELLTRVFPADEESRHGSEPLRDQPALLTDGILFDDSGRTLRWGTPLHELVTIEAPAIKWYPRAISLCWMGRTCLRGLNCDVETSRWFGAPEPRVYHHYLEGFHWVHLLMNVELGAIDGARECGFRELYARLEGIFGPATFSSPPCEGELRVPSIHWEFRGMNIQYSLFGPRPSLYISREPDGYPALKADARAIARWQGRGSRVDYVAWPDLEHE